MDNNFDYDNAINFLLNNKVSNINDNSIILQDKIMNSNDFNSSMNYIEESLNLFLILNLVFISPLYTVPAGLL